MTRTHLTRTLTTLAFIAGTEWVSAQQPVASPAERVRHLYEAAAYGEALEAIDRIGVLPAPESSESAVLLRYRALSLLALDRTPEAETAVEQLLIKDPGYSADPSDTSPRFIAVLDRMRNQVLPVLARQRYEDAKRSFDERRLEPAASGFAKVIELLDHPAIDPSVIASSRDLRTLAAGFLELSRGAAPRPSQPEVLETTMPQTDSPPVVGTAARSAGRIYSAADRDVTPPDTVRQDLPDWRIATPGTRRFAGRFEGELDIVIDETGRVESATLVKSIFPAYNALAIAGSKNWQYTPAMRDGVPVKFKKPVQISVVIPR